MTNEEIQKRAKAIGDRQAFPTPYGITEGGLTVRQYATIQVFAGMCGDEFDSKRPAQMSSEWADALLETLAKQELKQ